MFVKSEKILQAVALINQLDDSKFPLLLSRILQRMHLKEDIFTKDEESKLTVSLSVDQNELTLILQTLTFFFQQAIYHLAKPGLLAQQLQHLTVSEEKVSAITQAWVSNARAVTERFKKQSIIQKSLSDVSWQLRLQMNQDTISKMKTPVAVLELTLDSGKEKGEKIQLEFTHEKLYSFYNQLEVIQAQLDALR